MASVDGKVVSMVIDVRPPGSSTSSTRRTMVGMSGSGRPSASAKPSSNSRWWGAATDRTRHQPRGRSPPGPVMK